MPAPILDITDIEAAAEARLVEKIAPIRKSAIQKDGRYLFTNPALAITIYESGRWQKTGKRVWTVPCTLTVLLTVSSAKSEEDRRRIANPLVFAIILALTGQDLGLDLTDTGIEPQGFSDVTDEVDWKNNKIVYLVEFSLGFNFTLPREEDEALDLIGVAIDYLLQPGDETPDAQDETAI